VLIAVRMTADHQRKLTKDLISDKEFWEFKYEELTAGGLT